MLGRPSTRTRETCAEQRTAFNIPNRDTKNQPPRSAFIIPDKDAKNRLQGMTFIIPKRAAKNRPHRSQSVHSSVEAG